MNRSNQQFENSSKISDRRLVLLRGLQLEKQRRTEDHTLRQQRIEAIEESRERCKSFSGFIAEAWHLVEPVTPYVYSWHNGIIAEHLEAMHRGEIRHLQINQPPGTMKSLTASVLWPAWEWTTDDWLRYLTTSYKEGYAVRDSRRHRDIVMSEWYRDRWPYVKLERDSEADFTTYKKGGRLAVAMNALTAGRGNRVIIDDPHSTEQAESDADREKTTRIFRESAQSRVNDPEKDAILVIMHRLHPLDVCGVIEDLGLPYVKLILPMEYQRSLTVKTPYFIDPRKEEGELLCPNRMGEKEVAARKLASGPHAWDTQYQQMAKAREGSFYFNAAHILVPQPTDQVDEHGQLVMELHPVEYPAICDTVFAVCDTATKIAKTNDGTGVAWFAATMYPRPSAVILDWDYIQLKASVLDIWLPTVWERAEQLATMVHARSGSQGVYIEDKDSGQVLIQKAEEQEWPVHAIPSDLTAMGKDGRALSASGYVYKGWTKMSRIAYDKTVSYKGRTLNHMYDQITSYRMSFGTARDEDEMFDIFCYANLLAFGDQEGH